MRFQHDEHSGKPVAHVRVLRDEGPVVEVRWPTSLANQHCVKRHGGVHRSPRDSMKRKMLDNDANCLQHLACVLPSAPRWHSDSKQPEHRGGNCDEQSGSDDPLVTHDVAHLQDVDWWIFNAASYTGPMRHVHAIRKRPPSP